MKRWVSNVTIFLAQGNSHVDHAWRCSRPHYNERDHERFTHRLGALEDGAATIHLRSAAGSKDGGTREAGQVNAYAIDLPRLKQEIAYFSRRIEWSST